MLAAELDKCKGIIQLASAKVKFLEAEIAKRLLKPTPAPAALAAPHPGPAVAAKAAPAVKAAPAAVAKSAPALKAPTKPTPATVAKAAK